MGVKKKKRTKHEQTFLWPSAAAAAGVARENEVTFSENALFSYCVHPFKQICGILDSENRLNTTISGSENFVQQPRFLAIRISNSLFQLW